MTQVLSAADEVRLARRISVGLYVEHAVASGRLAKAGLDQEMAHRLVREGREAFENFVDANRGLVGWECRRWAGGRVEESGELFQEGCLGLIEAVRRWDEEGGSRFSTYALYWIRERVRLAALTQGGRTGVPGRAVRRAREGELSEPLAARVMALSHAASLSTPEGGELPVVAAQEAGDDEVLADALSVLDPVERRVVLERAGWWGQARGRREVARRLGMSERLLAAVEARALEKAREAVVHDRAA